MSAPTTGPSRRRRVLTLALGGAVLVVALVLLVAWQWHLADLRAERQTGLELASAGRFENARPLLERALARSPNDLPVVKALARGRFAEAQSLTDAEGPLSRWCDLEPANPNPFLMRLELYARLHDPEKAVPDGLHVLRLDPDNQAVRKGVVWMLLNLGHFEEARREGAEGRRRSPADPEWSFLLAKADHLQ